MEFYSFTKIYAMQFGPYTNTQTSLVFVYLFLDINFSFCLYPYKKKIFLFVCHGECLSALQYFFLFFFCFFEKGERIFPSHMFMYFLYILYLFLKHKFFIVELVSGQNQSRRVK